jgi:hypothetical protein
MYDYRCVKTASGDCDWDAEIQTTIDKRDEPLAYACPVCGSDIERHLPSPPGFADPMRLGRIKAPDAFKDILKNIKKKMPGNQINTQ